MTREEAARTIGQFMVHGIQSFGATPVAPITMLANALLALTDPTEAAGDRQEVVVAEGVVNIDKGWAGGGSLACVKGTWGLEAVGSRLCIELREKFDGHRVSVIVRDVPAAHGDPEAGK